MSECPPKKKLRQLSLTEMFMQQQQPSTSKDNKEEDLPLSQTIETDSDNSQTIASSIECLKLENELKILNDNEKIKDEEEITSYCKEKIEREKDEGENPRKYKEKIEREKDEEESPIKYKEKNKSENGRDTKLKRTEEGKEKSKKIIQDTGKYKTKYKRTEEKEKMESENIYEEKGEKEKLYEGEKGEREAYRKRGDKYRNKEGHRKSIDNREEDGRNGGKNTQKNAQKMTPRKSPRKSPYKEKEGRIKKEPSDLRSILAGAAERRMKSAPSTSTSTRVHQLSPDLFDEDANITTEEEETTWSCTPLADLNRLSNSNLNVPPVTPSQSHTILVKLPLPNSGPPLPYPSSYSDIWDQGHVRMPCSPKSQYPLSKDSDIIVSRWSVISRALQQDMKSVEDFQNAVLQYNTRYANKWKFKGLQYLLEQELDEEETDHFFNDTLPAMAHLALRLPKLLTQPPPLLTQHYTHSITLSQLQIASLLANAFFCTFPRRNAKGSDTEYASFPDINFNRLFFHKEKRALEKMKCLLNYFRRVTMKEPTGNVTFTRQHIDPSQLPEWMASCHHLPRIHIDTAGLIEEAEGLLQVDFANKYLGGGVLGLGCVQEEIRFVLSPELLVSRLFTQVLEKTEALIITGVEQFNLGSGYASTFCWNGSCEDETQCDSWGRKLCQVTAIDALHFTKQPRIQYKDYYIERELNKAYAGFCVIDKSGGSPVAVATGNWGCGAFKGNPRLKALIQLAVCGYVGRDLAYFTFGDTALRDDLITMYIFLKENNVTVGELVQVLKQHGSRDWADGSDLFTYIYHSLGNFDDDTDPEASNSNESSKKTSHNPSKPHNPTQPTISEYFKFKPSKPSTSSSQSASHKGRQRADSEGGISFKEALSDEKILEVLSECDRLVEEQRKGEKKERERKEREREVEIIGEKERKGEKEREMERKGEKKERERKVEREREREVEIIGEMERKGKMERDIERKGEREGEKEREREVKEIGEKEWEIEEEEEKERRGEERERKGEMERKGEKREIQHKELKEREKVPKSTKDSKLLSYLDEIDTQILKT